MSGQQGSAQRAGCLPSALGWAPLPGEGTSLPAAEKVGNDFKGRRGDDFQGLKNTNSSSPSFVLSGPVFLVSLAAPLAPLRYDFTLFRGKGRDAQLVSPEKTKTLLAAAQHGPCGCGCWCLQLHKA